MPVSAHTADDKKLGSNDHTRFRTCCGNNVWLWKIVMDQFSPRVFGVCLLVISVLIGMIFLGPLLWFNRIDIIDYANLGWWREVEAQLNSNFSEFIPESDNRYRVVVNYSYEFNDKKYTGTWVRLFTHNALIPENWDNCQFFRGFKQPPSLMTFHYE